MKHDFSQFKPSAVEALSAPLPAGERLIWQGKPSVKGLALRAFHIREVAIYFAALLVWRVWSNTAAGLPANEVMMSAAWLAIPAVAGIAVLAMLAWLFARAACYTVTSKRVLVQFGVALPMTMNIPLDRIVGAAVKIHSDGSGDIPLTLADDKASFLLLWPHVRPWKLRAAEPMLRAVPDAAIVAAKLNEALSGQPGPSALALNKTGTVRDTAIPADAIAAA